MRVGLHDRKRTLSIVSSSCIVLCALSGVAYGALLGTKVPVEALIGAAIPTVLFLAWAVWQPRIRFSVNGKRGADSGFNWQGPVLMLLVFAAVCVVAMVISMCISSSDHSRSPAAFPPKVETKDSLKLDTGFGETPNILTNPQ